MSGIEKYLFSGSGTFLSPFRLSSSDAENPGYGFRVGREGANGWGSREEKA